MSQEQRGKYISLICYQHQLGHLTKEDMVSVCGSIDEKIFSKFDIDEKGLYFNARLETEKTKRNKFTKSRINNLSHMDSHMENVNEIENSKELLKTTKEEKVKFLDFVQMTQGQYDQLAKKLGKTVLDEYVERLNNYIGSKGKRYKSHYHTILSWTNKDKPVKAVVRREEPIDRTKPDPKQQEKVSELIRQTVKEMK